MKRLFETIRLNIKLRRAMKKLKSQDAQVRSTAAMELGEIRDPCRISYLIDSLGDESADVREAAATWLGTLGDDRAVEPLRNCWWRPEWASINHRSQDGDGYEWAHVPLEAVARSLAKLGKSGIRALVDILGNEDAREPSAAFNAIVSVGSEAVPTLLELAEQKPQCLSILLDVLREIGDTRAEQLFRSEVSNPDPVVRVAVAKALAGMTGADVATQLLSLLDDDHDRVREEAALALGAQGNAASVPRLIRSLGDDSAYVRAKAAYALGRIGDKRALDPLIGVFENVDPSKCYGPNYEAESYRHELKATATAMTQLQSPFLSKILGELLYKHNDAFRPKALAQALVNSGTPDLVALGQEWVKHKGYKYTTCWCEDPWGTRRKRRELCG